jgi:outer membrane protein assembly factor BamA
VNASAPIFRELLQGAESSSLIGFSMRRDTRNDRYSATSGHNSGLTVEYAGLGGFSNFFRIEGRHAWYLGAPGWLIKNSTFVLGGRVGYTVPFNTWTDYDLGLDNVPKCRIPGECIEVANLDQISRDLKLPLSERYFLGGIGAFQLRGFEARSVGPRRAVLRRSGLDAGGELFYPVGRELRQDANTGILEAVCTDVTAATQGNRNGRCNSLTDTQLSDFDDLGETDVVGGSKFFTVNLEYRFPVSEEIGLQGILFVDMGGSFAEEDSLLESDYWRYGYGGGVLWFSPFGPLQLVLGFPVNPYGFEKSPVFEFSVGGFGL